MHNTRKRKVIDIEPDKLYYESGGDGLIVPITLQREIKLAGKISRHYNYFMKFFYGDGRLTRVQQKAGADSQYLFPLSECIIDGNNQILMSKFKSSIDLSSTGYAELTKRLKDKGLIGREKREWYANPFIFGYGKDVDEKVFHLFREKTSQLYGITEL